ncbi:MAG: ABC transporter permease [Planctomycetota bacterium]|jgi:peptide/nickel transport system permease protein|nr:ABC transporter permease [Planctomycetota bacterium]
MKPVPPWLWLWRRYRRTTGGRIGLCLISVFILTAFLAPFLAHRLPFRWEEPGSGAVTYPLLREFFAPSDTTEPILERSLNFAFLFLPLAAGVWLVLRRYLPGLWRHESRFVTILFALLLALTVWLGLGGMIWEVGGSDWLEQEKRPFPDLADMDNPDLAIHLLSGGVAPVPSDPESSQVREVFFARLLSSGLLVHATPDSPLQWSNRERLPGDLGEILLESPLHESEVLPAPGLATLRFNRLLLDQALPGFFTPYREFRSGFLILAALTLLALLGLSYILLAGANQFPLSPAWLVILLLALLLHFPFRAVARNDQTPYRELARSGQGKGFFPPLPYGPNEQGFGPLLPPDWAVEAPELSSADILDWRLLKTTFANPQAGFPTELQDLTEPADILAALNQLIQDSAWPDPSLALDNPASTRTQPYLQALANGQRLTPLEQRRLNRLRLENLVPGAFRPVPASHWKRPRHLDAYHWLGTDESGRDVLTRLLHGARVSLSVGFVSVALATLIGLVIGSIAAYYGGWTDLLISRFMELMLCFPSFFLILAVIAVLDRRSILNIMLVIGFTSWTGVARLIRGEILKLKKMDYVLASITLGATDQRTIFRHILPNAMAPVLVSISFGITGAILTEASLSFIGFGVTPPTPTWGQLLSETRDSPLANWWLAVFPGLVLFFGVFSYNLVGEALRDALDPRATLRD